MSAHTVTRRRSNSRFIYWIVGNALFGSVIFVTGMLGFLIDYGGAVQGVPWLPAGIGFAAFLMTGFWLWPGLLVAVFLVGMAEGYGPEVSVAMAAGTLVGILAGAGILRRLVEFRSDFGRQRDVFSFLLLGGVLGTMVGTTASMGYLRLRGIIAAEEFWSYWILWWGSSAASVATVGPIVVVFWSRDSARHISDWRHTAEGMAAATAVVLSSLIAFSPILPLATANYPLAYVPFPFLAWAALRFGPRGATAALAVVCLSAAAGTWHGYGPFVQGDNTATLVFLWGYMGVIPFSALIMNAVMSERRRAEGALAENEAHLRAILQSTGDGILVMDENNKMSHWNDQLLQMWGIPESVMASKDSNRMLDYVSSQLEDPAAFGTKVAEVRGMQEEYLDTMRFKDGRIIERYMKPLVQKDGTVRERVGSFRDITHLTRAEESLRESQEILRSVLDTIPVAVFWKDLDSVYQGCNRRFAADAGLESPEEIVGKTDFDLPWEEQAEFYRSGDRAVVESGEPELDNEESQTNSDGADAWFLRSKILLRDLDGGVVGVLGSYQDITERKNAEEALRASEASLAEAQRIAHLGKMEWNLATNTISLSDEVFRLLGRTPQAVGLSLDDLIEQVYEEDKDYFRTTVLSTRNTGMPNHMEWRMVRADGEVRHFYGQGERILNSEGRAEKIVATVQDITDRKKAEEERRSLMAQVQQAQKMESLGILAGGIAHDFNNLLTGILGNADLALLDLPADSESREYLEEVIIGSQRAAELCRQMLAYSGKGKFIIKLANLSELVEDMAHLLEASTSKHAVVRYDFARDLPSVEADVTQLRQVIMNLITNASDAVGEDHGVISISTGVMKCDKAYLASAYWDEEEPASEYVYLEVSDTGCGMDEETQPKIFDPFFTSKEMGHGLGLAAVLGIVRGHAGAIRVSSTVGKGTIIRVLFPASSEPAERIEPDKRPGIYRKARGTVLVVDDEETVLALSMKMLERAGFDVVTATNGKEAVDVFRDRSEEIAAVLLDMTMPVMGGEEAFREIRKLKSDVPVVLASGYSEQDVTERFNGSDISGFIQKPYRAVELTAMIGQVVSKTD